MLEDNVRSVQEEILKLTTNSVSNSVINEVRMTIETPQVLKMAKSSIPRMTDKTRFLNCLFCTKQFSLTERKPWFLKCCLNTVCSTCAQKLYVSDSGHVDCPICRKKIVVEESPRDNSNSGISSAFSSGISVLNSGESLSNSGVSGVSVSNSGVSVSNSGISVSNSGVSGISVSNSGISVSNSGISVSAVDEEWVDDEEVRVNGSDVKHVLENGIRGNVDVRKHASPSRQRKTRSRPRSATSMSSRSSASPVSSLDRVQGTQSASRRLARQTSRVNGFRTERRRSASADDESELTDEQTSVDVDDVSLSLDSSFDNSISWTDTRSTMSSASASLPLDPIRVKTIEFNKVQKCKPIPCSDCPLSRTSSWRCENCCLFLCDHCHDNHKSDLKTKRHTLVSFDVLKSRPIKLFNQNHFCKVHPFSRLTLFCCTCNTVICSSCTRNSHERKTHKITTVQEAFGARVKVAGKMLSEAKMKIKTISQRSSRLKRKQECSSVSVSSAEQMIITTFDSLSDAIQQRKSQLLSELLNSENLQSTEDAEEIGSHLSLLSTASDYAKELRSKADCVEFLQQYSSVTDALRGLMEGDEEEVQFSRKGVVFQETHQDLVEKLISSVGQLKSVTFRLIDNTEKEDVTIDPFNIKPVQSMESAVTLSGDIFSNDANSCELKCFPCDRVILLQTSDTIVKINCPSLHFDPATMFAERTITDADTLTNHPPDDPHPDTGCRLKSYPGALGDRAVSGYAILNPDWPASPRGKHMWVIKTTTNLKQKVPDNKMVFEASLSERPIDARFSQRVGSSVVLAGCDQHQALCLKVKYSGKVLQHVACAKNRACEKGNFVIGFLLDVDSASLHIFNMLTGQCIFSIHDIDVSKPLWPVFCVGRLTYADIKLKLVSGVNVHVPEGVSSILKSMYEEDRCSTLTFNVEEPFVK